MEMKKIKITQDKYVLVDDSDFLWLSQFNWQYQKYVAMNIRINNKKTRMLMHRYIMNAPKGMVVHHIDGNPLNNQKNNLRVCTQSDNQKHMKKFITNSSGFIGVHWDKSRGKWMASKCFNRVRTNIGRYDKKEDAIKAHINFTKLLK